MKSQNGRESVALCLVGGAEWRTCDGEVCTTSGTKVLHSPGSRLQARATAGCKHQDRSQSGRALSQKVRRRPRKDVRRCVGFSTCTLNFAPCTCCAPETSTRIMVRKTQRGCGKLRHRCRRCQWVLPASASSKRHQRKALPRHRGAEWLALPGRPNFGDSKVRQ